MMMYGGGMGSGWLLVALFWIALIALIIWLVVRLLPVKPSEPAAAEVSRPVAHSVAPSAEPALEILDRRLAAGELELDDYNTIRATILDGRGDAR